jgi:NAD(P)-dependent dehydrogenase (short-subunit alcohol dehydrogenase family)
MDLYDASKWALNGLGLSWAKELREHGIRVNNLCMGASDSPMQYAVHGYDSPEQIPADLRDSWLGPEAMGSVLIDLLAEGPSGRSGDNIGIWVGHPVVLPPPSPVLDGSK